MKHHSFHVLIIGDRVRLIEIRVGNEDAMALTSPGEAITVNSACGDPKSAPEGQIFLSIEFSCWPAALTGRYVTAQKLDLGTPYWELSEIKIYQHGWFLLLEKR